MKYFLVSVYEWENPRLISSGQFDLEKGDNVIVSGENGNELGTVVGEMEKKEKTEPRDFFSISRKATRRDIESYGKNQKKIEEILKIAKLETKRIDLKIKLVGARVSLDGSGVVIAFTAEERVDFRELVKNLSKIFHRSVKMQQIGSRDEARKLGGCGPCGRKLCCINFPGMIGSISTEMARIQQVSHRGSERISGACGRLMCCLSYEAQQYKEMLKGMPEIGSIVKTESGEGEVIEINAPREEFKLKLKDGNIITIKKKEVK